MTTGNVTVTGLIQVVDAETGKLVVVSKVKKEKKQDGVMQVSVLRTDAIANGSPSVYFRMKWKLRLCV